MNTSFGNIDNSERVVRVRRSPRSVIFQLSFAIAAAVLGIMFWNEPTLFTSPMSLFGIHFRLPIFLLLFLFLSLRPLFLLKDCRHEITPHHIRTVSGIFSLRRRETNIPYEDIRGVRAEQSLLERMLGVGTIVAWTQSGQVPEIRFSGIRDPQKIVKLVAEHIDRALLTQKPERNAAH